MRSYVFSIITLELDFLLYYQVLAKKTSLKKQLLGKESRTFLTAILIFAPIFNNLSLIVSH
ncbi:MAG: hypothetical protein CSA32_02545 [Desulfobulbus propionicus]|nr:MAG: hypothetical protein CSA32_02545 [Desulfobulbus propionicus]